MNKIELPDCCTHWGSLVWVKRLRAPKATTYSDTHRGSPVWVRKLRAPALPHAWYLEASWEGHACMGGRGTHGWAGHACMGGTGTHGWGRGHVWGRLELNFRTHGVCSRELVTQHRIASSRQPPISTGTAQSQHSHGTVTAPHRMTIHR